MHSTNKADNFGEFNQQFAGYEAAADDVKLPQFSLFMQNNMEYLKDRSVNDRMFNLCNRIKVAEGEDTQPLDAIKRIVRQARITPAHIEAATRNVRGVITSYLEPKDIAKLSQTSKAMSEKTSGVLGLEWAKVRAEITIGPEQWNKLLAVRGTEQDRLGLNFEAPQLPADIDQILKRDCPFCEGKKVFQTHKLVLMPGGLSINQQGRLMRHLREGENETVFSEASFHEVFRDIRNIPVDKPYWALVTTEVIPGSQNLSFEDQEKLVKEKEGYEVPSLLEAITLVTMDKECSGKEGYLLPEEPCTYSRCAEQELIVGDFALSGLDVSNFLPYGDAVLGVLALRKFL